MWHAGLGPLGGAANGPRRAATCRCGRRACTPASSRAGAGLPPAPAGSAECGALSGSRLLGILDPADELATTPSNVRPLRRLGTRRFQPPGLACPAWVSRATRRVMSSSARECRQRSLFWARLDPSNTRREASWTGSTYATVHLPRVRTRLS